MAYEGNLTDDDFSGTARIPSRDLRDTFHLADRLQDLVQVGVVLDLHQHRSEDDAVLRRELGTADVGSGAADRLADIGVEAAPVLAARERQQVGTVVAVDRDATALGDVADDGVAGDRLAALGVTDHQALDAVNLDAAAEAETFDDAPERRRLRGVLFVGRYVGIQRVDHLADLHVPATDGGLHLLGGAESELLRGLFQLL